MASVASLAGEDGDGDGDGAEESPLAPLMPAAVSDPSAAVLISAGSSFSVADEWRTGTQEDDAEAVQGRNREGATNASVGEARRAAAAAADATILPLLVMVGCGKKKK